MALSREQIDQYIDLQITDPLNRQNTAARVRAVLHEMNTSMFNALNDTFTWSNISGNPEDNSDLTDYINSLVGDVSGFIPLAGTDSGLPILGDLEVESGTEIFSSDGSTVRSSLILTDSIATLSHINLSNDDTTIIKVGAGGEAEVSSDVANFAGLRYGANYGADFEDDSLVDKQFAVGLISVETLRAELVEDGLQDQIDDIEAAMSSIAAGIHLPVANIAALKALDTTSSTDYPDKYIITVEAVNNIYMHDRDSAAVGDDDLVVEPTVGTGRWIKLITGGAITYATSTEVNVGSSTTVSLHPLNLVQKGLVKNNVTTTNPTVTDDSAAYYSPGSTWLNTTTKIKFTCISNGVGAAVWEAPFETAISFLNQDTCVDMYKEAVVVKEILSSSQISTVEYKIGGGSYATATAPFSIAALSEITWRITYAGSDQFGTLLIKGTK